MMKLAQPLPAVWSHRHWFCAQNSIVTQALSAGTVIDDGELHLRNEILSSTEMDYQM